MDNADRLLIETLFENGKTPLKELAAKVGLSAPSTSERLKRLEERGVIKGYTLNVVPEQIGYPLRAIVRVSPMPGQLQKVTKLIQQTAEITECDKVTGEDCFVCKIHLKSIEQLDLILDGISQYAATNSSIVKSSPVKRRLPPL
ncbi:HTH-type transcriptional regulator LrpA [Maritalea myrionectae]|uniref:HTH-type transcriptional regulator LrpA n=1 Tax=Maritalea myrionectae TaxID=454601 RepID=A0A2R4MGS1_9HYPH|nr:Lrp/AsnC family transcriptional regulator [Maritalea myrionectae]AVX05200.1 HTH-type transcriptional regulator LrpA [Maritalea myrionectae]